MRKGLLWTIVVVLAGIQNLQAQQSTGQLQAALGAPQPAQQQQPAPKSELPAACNSPCAMAPSCFVATDCAPCCFRGWISAEYLMWWVKSAPLNSPLVTTSSNFSALPPAALGQPGTQILLGDQPMGFGLVSGMRFGAGVNLSSNLSIEGSYFLMQRRSAGFNAFSDAKGNPIIANPFFNSAIGAEDALLNSNPDGSVGPWKGGTNVAAFTQLQGWDLNLAAGDYSPGGIRMQGLLGFRTLNLNEDLNINNSYQPLSNGVLTFLGNGVNVGSTISDSDRFHADNSFYGGQIGARASWQRGRLSVDATGKVALGVTQQRVAIDGFSILSTPGSPTAVAAGGTYAQVTNIGSYYRSAFSVVPEVGATVGWSITSSLKATVGYSFLYWTDVARPGNQIDHTVNQNVIPTHQSYGQGPSGGRPAFSFHDSDFWAQGITFGLTLRY